MGLATVQEDLARSGLVSIDMDIRPLESPERATCSIPPALEGYVIPYYSIQGNLLPFYRCRIFESGYKYKQLTNSQNHIYFPKNFRQAIREHKRDYILFVEGEKKAAAATKAGFPAVGVGGVDSWKTRTLILPGDTSFETISADAFRPKLKAKLPANTEITETDNLAVGFKDLTSFIMEKKLAIIIIYDSDEKGTKYQVQRAAAALGFELRYQGIPFNKIRQVILPPTNPHGKMGIDDFLQTESPGKLQLLITKALNRRTAFPRHPNVREFVNKKLQRSKLSRKETQALGLAVLCDMDTGGRRLRSTSEDQLYYFDNLTRRLIKAQMVSTAREVINDTEFGRHLYNEFGLSLADHKLLTWFGTQFSAEEPVETVQPHRIICRNNHKDDNVLYQINDGQYVKVTSGGVEVCDNGTGGVLFESGLVKGIDASDLLVQLKLREDEDIKPWWEEVIGNVRLRKDPRLAQLTTLLFYISPWLYRWRGTQLPVEMIIGEAGSGKSSLYELRLNILVGHPLLRNAPADLKDWHASIANSGGLHVVDNVQLVDKQLRQRLSDEICRLVTEPTPHIEARKLYSNNELVRVPINTVFAITAIQQPFLNADLIQRAFIIELDKSSIADITYDSDWAKHQMELHGDRAVWISHHLYILSKFFRLAEKKWNPNYQARHRLINFEQILVLMAETLGMDSDWIPEYLSGRSDKAISESDWALEGLIRYSEFVRRRGSGCYDIRFTASDIAIWAAEQEDFMQCIQITNSRRLGRYIQSHKQMISSVASIVGRGKANNLMHYGLRRK